MHSLAMFSTPRWQELLQNICGDDTACKERMVKQVEENTLFAMTATGVAALGIAIVGIVTAVATNRAMRAQHEFNKKCLVVAVIALGALCTIGALAQVLLATGGLSLAVMAGATLAGSSICCITYMSHGQLAK
jgi:energy-converting hydrogenase Eha subunit H